MRLSDASFALKVVRRNDGDAAILYRRTLNEKQVERLSRIVAISPLAFTAGAPLLRAAVRSAEGPTAQLAGDHIHPLDNDWGARVACYGAVAVGLRNATGLSRAATQLQHADGAEAAWWLGLMQNGKRLRAVRALRILVEAVK